MLPNPNDHGEHKAATILVLEAVASLPTSAFSSGRKPIVIGGTNPESNYTALQGYPITAAPAQSLFYFNRSTLLNANDTLSYMLIVAWSYACHKSQGGLTMELTTGLQQSIEYYWVYSLNDVSAIPFLKSVFDLVASVGWVNRWDQAK
jgi:hypothetical protein